jgi:hypothetical protein
MINIGMTLLILAIISAVGIFLLAFSPGGVHTALCGLPIILVIISMIFITQGMKTEKSSDVIDLQPFQRYPSRPNLQKKSLTIGIIFIFLTIINLAYIAIKSSRNEWIYAYFVYSIYVFAFAAIVFIFHGLSSRQRGFTFSLWPFPRYPTPPSPQQMVKCCINCNRGIPPDTILCPYCRFKSQEKG